MLRKGDPTRAAMMCLAAFLYDLQNIDYASRVEAILSPLSSLLLDIGLKRVVFFDVIQWTSIESTELTLCVTSTHVLKKGPSQPSMKDDSTKAVGDGTVNSYTKTTHLMEKPYVLFKELKIFFTIEPLITSLHQNSAPVHLA